VYVRLCECVSLFFPRVCVCVRVCFLVHNPLTLSLPLSIYVCVCVYVCMYLPEQVSSKTVGSVSCFTSRGAPCFSNSSRAKSTMPADCVCVCVCVCLCV
jgi:hypothetical protein